MIGGLLWANSLGAADLAPPRRVQVFDTPSDGGGSLTVLWEPATVESSTLRYQVHIEETNPSSETSGPASTPVRVLVADFPANTHFVRDAGFAWWTRPAPDDHHLVEITNGGELTIKDGTPYTITLTALDGEQKEETRIGPGISAPNWINWKLLNNFGLVVLFGLALFGSIQVARKAQANNREIFLRRIPGLDAVDEAIGRATELGKPILYLTGAGDMSQPATIAASVILGRVGKRVATYETDLLVPHRNPIVMAVCQEITKQAYLEAGKADIFKEDSNFFITDDQFSYTAAVDGLMLRRKPAANFFMGSYYAESLLLTETGASTGAIQIAGTDSDHQLPFFVTTCDYTLIGEELYAASAYLSREPVQVGTLRGQDLVKGVILGVLVLGTVVATMGVWLDLQWTSYFLDVFRDLK